MCGFAQRACPAQPVYREGPRPRQEGKAPPRVWWRRRDSNPLQALDRRLCSLYTTSPPGMVCGHIRIAPACWRPHWERARASSPKQLSGGQSLFVADWLTSALSGGEAEVMVEAHRDLAGNRRVLEMRRGIVRWPGLHAGDRSRRSTMPTIRHLIQLTIWATTGAMTATQFQSWSNHHLVQYHAAVLVVLPACLALMIAYIVEAIRFPFIHHTGLFSLLGGMWDMSPVTVPPTLMIVPAFYLATGLGVDGPAMWCVVGATVGLTAALCGRRRTRLLELAETGSPLALRPSVGDEGPLPRHLLRELVDLPLRLD